jgi:UMF1 family MFS transporter
MPAESHSKLDRKTVFAWSMYDFANSSFTTLVVTFVYAYFFSRLMAADDVVGTALWTRGIAATAVIVALLSPIMGALADRGGYRKAFMLFFTVVGVIATFALYFALPYETTRALGISSHALRAIIIFVIANVAFEMGGVFYNAFLPDIAPPDKIGRVSGYGWALGYLGGLLCLFVALFTLVWPDNPIFGFSTEASSNVRATNLLVAAWFALFSIPTFLILKEDRSAVSPRGTNVLTAGFVQLANTFREIRKYRQVVRLLIARLVFNDGLVTIFALGGVYVGLVFDFSFEEVMIFGIVTNVTAGLGAWAFGFIDDKIGGKRTIAITIVGLSLATLVAWLTPNRLVSFLGFSFEGKYLLWLVGAAIGVFAGPNQASSRSLLGRFVPPEKENEFYGFYAFSGKATAFFGPFMFGVLTTQFGTQRAGLVAILVLFLIGGLLLIPVNESEGIKLAHRESEPAS